MTLAELQAAVAAALADLDPDWTVHPAPVDQLEPPAFIVQAGRDPWLTPLTGCVDRAETQVLVVAYRLTPEGAYPVLLDMVDRSADALAAAGFRPYETDRPGPFEIGQVTYLAARHQIRHPVTRNEGAL